MSVVPGATPYVGTAHVDLEVEDVASSKSEVFECHAGVPIGGKVAKKRAMMYSPNPTPSKRRTDRNSRLRRILDLVEKEISNSSVTSTSQVSIDPVRKEMQEMVKMVVDDGAKPGSDEHFYATHLFMEKKYRDVFITLKTPNVRLAWLKTTWEDRERH